MQKLTLFIMFFCFFSALTAQEANFQKADELYAKGVDAYQNHRYDEAFNFFSDCKTLNEGRQEPYYSSNSFSYMARIYYLKGNEKAARSLTLDYRVEPVDLRRTIVPDSLGYLGVSYFKQMNYDLAEPMFSQELALEEKILGENHYSCANTRFLLGFCQFVHKKYKVANSTLKKSLNIWLNCDKLNSIIPTIYDAFCASLDSIDAPIEINYCDSIINLYADNDTIQKELIKSTRLPYNYALDNYITLQDFQTALSYGLKAINTYACDTTNILYPAINIKVARIYNYLGNKDKSNQYIEILLNFLKKVELHTEGDIIHFNSCIDLLENISKYNKAIEVFDILLNKINKKYGKTSEEYLSALIRKGYCYLNLYDYSHAQACFKEVLEVAETTFSNHSTEYLTCYLSSAIPYKQKGDYSEALKIYNHALELCEDVNLEKDIKYSILSINSLNNKADINLSIAQDLDYVNSTRRDDNIGNYAYAGGLSRLGLDYYENKEYEKAINCFKESLEIKRGQYGRYSEDDLYLIFQIGMAYLKLEDNDNANLYFTDWQKRFISKTKDKIRFQNKYQQELTWDESESSKFTPIINSLNQTVEPLCNSYDMCLFTKNLLLTAGNNISDMILKSDNSAIKNKYFILNELRQKETSLQNGIFQEESNNLILQDSINTLENEIIEDLSHIGNFTDNLDLKWQDIRNQLKENEIAIEFVRFGKDEDDYLFAFLLCKDWNNPKSVILCQNSYINNIKADSINTILSSKELGDKIWKEILDEAKLEEGGNIYFSPDGALYQIPIEDAYLEDGKRLSEKYHVYRLSSTGEICKKKNTVNLQSIGLIGGVKYDSNPSSKIASKEDEETDRFFHQYLTKYRDADRSALKYLPGSLKEVNDISSILANKAQSKITLYTGADASEANMRTMSGNSPKILHIATHGWNVEKILGDSMVVNNQKISIDHLLERSGLLFAGAQQTLSGNTSTDTENDGILTAREISGLDLRNTDLAVLSACQTGIGDQTSDGVAGLQRGFKQAGVNSIMMSLWNVDDSATQLLMTQFYTNLALGKTKVESLKEAQKFVRNYEQDGEKIFSSPIYWAGFVLQDALE